MIFCFLGVHLHASSAWPSSFDPVTQIIRPNYTLLRQPSTTLAGWLWPIAFGFSKHTRISSMLILVPFCPQLLWFMLLYSFTFIHCGTFLHFMVVKMRIWLFFCASTCQIMIKDTILCAYMICFVVWTSQLHSLIWLMTSMIGSARDMPGSASWPKIGKASLSKKQTSDQKASEIWDLNLILC